MAKKTQDVPQSIFGRSLRLMKTGVSIVARETIDRVAAKVAGTDDERRTDTRVKQAQELVKTLGRLKGAAMKAGQMLSLEASDLLPKEALDVLRQLHDSAPPLPFSTIESILRRELGAAGFERLKDLTPEPIAAASIGQVHAATVDGRPVVLKVQFPGIAKSIDSDLKAVKGLAETLVKLNGKSINLDDLFEELARGLKNEVNYVREAQNLAVYRKAFADDERFEIPEVLRDLSTECVLTMTRVEGAKIKDWLASDPPADARRRFTHLVLDLVIKEFVEIGIVQTDPNYGNFLYRPSEGRMVLLDFGATQEYGMEFRRDYQELFKIGLACERQRLVERAVAMGLFDARESAVAKNHFADMVELIVGMYRPENQPFDFSDLAYLEAIRDKALDFAMAVQHSAPPKQIVFLNRKLGGMFHLLKEVGSKLNLTPFVERALKTA